MSNHHYDLAKEILTRAYPHRVKSLDGNSYPWDEDIKRIWNQMTKNERGWYVLFSLVEYWHDWNALAAISPDPEITRRYHKIYNDRRNAYNRDIATMSNMDNWLKLVESFKPDRDNKRGYKQSYGAQDIPFDLDNRAVWDSEASDGPCAEAEGGPLSFEAPSRPLWY